MEAEAYYEKLKEFFYEQRDSDNAAPMKAYMKNHFDFLGIKTPLRKELFRSFSKKQKLPDLTESLKLSKLLWHDPYREMQYLALDILEKNVRNMDDTFLDRFVWLIIHKSWWDTVDRIAPNLCGKVLLKYPDKKQKLSRQWNRSDNIWLQRTSILFQLKYREHTDFDLLKEYILNHADSQEFFVQKASGWALRQYSKHNSVAVRTFLEKHQSKLSKLTVKEGSKYV